MQRHAWQKQGATLHLTGQAKAFLLGPLNDEELRKRHEWVGNFKLISSLSFTASPLRRITVSGVSLNTGTLSIALPPFLPRHTAALAFLCSGFTHCHVGTDFWQLFKGFCFVPMEELDVSEERKWVQELKRLKQKPRAETTETFATQ